MLINSSVIDHLRRYFDLACAHYEESSYGLATFFAITIIEECAKILYLRDADLTDEKQRRAVLSHNDKHLVAFVNLLTGSDRFDTLPQEWQDLVWSRFPEEMVRLRNRSLYIWFNDRKELTVPDETISAKEAALLVYLSGFAAGELGEYVGLDPEWVRDIQKSSTAFREKRLAVSRRFEEKGAQEMTS